MMSSVIFAHSDDSVASSNIASSIRAGDLNLVYTSIGSIPLVSFGYFRAQLDVMRVYDAVVPCGQGLVATYRKTAHRGSAAGGRRMISDKHIDQATGGAQCVGARSNIGDVRRSLTCRTRIQ